ncbi:DNA-methyltransferase [Streptomyces sp. NPDC059474]|uniref:DNA-methyltransferase n=1 Tax=Streptomyces sp. NPDC059474 TaxID=3346846 RepID=UPI0036911399
MTIESTVAGDRCELGALHGFYYWGNSLELMARVPDGSVAAVICSPPFEGAELIADSDRTGEAFLHWLTPFFDQFRRVLRPGGCVAFELGGIWLSDAPGKAVQHAGAVHALAAAGWRLVQDFYYFNPQLLRPEPGGAARAADSVTPIWVMSRTHEVYYDVEALERPTRRPFVRGNLLEFDTSGVYDQAYEKALAETSLQPYVDRWPTVVPELFVDLLTRPGDLVLDPFAGSGATCFAAERLRRQWLGFELDRGLELHVRAMFGTRSDGAGKQAG